jgi:hypothetical protein
MTRREEVRVGEFHITDGRVTMDTDGTEGDLTVGVPRHTPLSGGEPHAYLQLSGEDFGTIVELNADDCAALATALEAAPEEPDAE